MNLSGHAVEFGIALSAEHVVVAGSAAIESVEVVDMSARGTGELLVTDWQWLLSFLTHDLSPNISACTSLGGSSRFTVIP